MTSLVQPISDTVKTTYFDTRTGGAPSSSSSSGRSSGGGGGGGGKSSGSSFADLVSQRQSGLDTATYEAQTAQADRNAAYQSELGNIDVWAAEQAVNDSKDAQNRSYDALSKLTSGRSVGGGSYSNLMAGRGSVNLGSLSGGLSAANTAKLVETKKTAAGQTYAAENQAGLDKYNAANQNTNSGYNNAWSTQLRNQGWSEAQISAGAGGWSMGIGNYKQRIGVNGGIETSDANGNFSGDWYM